MPVAVYFYVTLIAIGDYLFKYPVVIFIRLSRTHVEDWKERGLDSLFSQVFTPLAWKMPEVIVK